VDANLKDLKTQKASAADQAAEKKFRAGLNKQIASLQKKASLLGKKIDKKSIAELIKIIKSESKFNAV